MARSKHTVGTREWEKDVYEHFREHVETEAELLTEYRELAEDESTSPAFRYLAAMILADEIRHHRVFSDLTETMREMVAGEDGTHGVPSLRGLHADRIRTERITDRLIDVERQDLKELKDLAKRLKDFDHITLWGLLIELMIDDTKKHIKILEFIQDRAKDQPD